MVKIKSSEEILISNPFNCNISKKNESSIQIGNSGVGRTFKIASELTKKMKMEGTYGKER